MNDLIRKCIYLLVSNRSINSILAILLDYILQQTGNKHGFIGERKVSKDNRIFYRYHAVTMADSSNTYMSKYKMQGYFDLDTEHAMHADISTGDIYINNSPKITKVGHPPVEKTLCLPLHDTNRTVIGILGLSGSEDFTPAIANSYGEFTDMCSYILQMAIERNNMNYHKNRFLTNIGNALREPIDGMLNVRKIVNTQSTPSPSQKEYIDVVTFYSMKLLDMVNDIQDYTRMVSGNLNLINKTMDLNKCLDAVLLISQQKTNPHVTLTLERRPDLPSIIVADEVRLTQILVNLLDNACKFTTKGSIKLTISARPGANGTHELVCCLIDTGIGMTPEQVYNIFGGTYIAVSGEKHVGVGLGLLIVKYLIEMFGGTINMESEQGIGTTVRFNLFVGHKHILTTEQIKSHFHGTYAMLHGGGDLSSLVDHLSLYGIKSIQTSNVQESIRFLTHKSFIGMFSMVFFGKTATDSEKETICKKIDSPVNIIHVSDSPSSQHNFVLSPPINHEAVTHLLTAIITDTKKHHIKTKEPPGRILIAEDNKEHLAILIDLLKRLNYTQIDTVSDGLELYIKLTSRASVYQMVFVNVHIGVLDGITVVKRYKQTVLSPIIHTIIIGMSDNHDLKDQCYDAGMNGYIVKPVKQKDLDLKGI